MSYVAVKPEPETEKSDRNSIVMMDPVETAITESEDKSPQPIQTSSEDSSPYLI